VTAFSGQVQRGVVPARHSRDVVIGGGVVVEIEWYCCHGGMAVYGVLVLMARDQPMMVEMRNDVEWASALAVAIQRDGAALWANQTRGCCSNRRGHLNIVMFACLYFLYSVPSVAVL